MAVNLGALTKDKRLLAVAAAGGALGLFALVKKRGSASTSSTGATGGTSTSGTTSGAGYTTGYTPGGLGSYDSSATDAYNNINTEVNNRLDQFGQTITGIQSTLANLGTTSSTGATTTTASGDSSAPTTTTAAPKLYSVRSGDNWNTVAAQFGLTTQQALDLNKSRGPARLVGGEVLRVG